MTDSGSRPHSGLRRLFAAAFSTDCALFLVNSAVPFKALRLGADPLALGLLAAASTGAYALFVNVSGRASDRVSRLTLARLSCMGVIVACIGYTMATTRWETDDLGELDFPEAEGAPPPEYVDPSYGFRP